MNKKVILLLTHKDSDNLGDQFIEACDVAIVHTIMNNLGYSETEYELISQKAAIVTPEAVKTGNQELLKTAGKFIKKADLIIVGGAPQFNYIYQYFLERSVVIMKLARKYNKPLIFSAVGIEDYNPNDSRCQKLKRALKYDCVKMVTTRDDFWALKDLKVRDEMVIGQVADPAVFSRWVFHSFRNAQPGNKIGLFIIRGQAFCDNDINFTEEDATNLWLGLIDEIVKRGYDYELVTSGHFSDEAFIDHLIRNCGVKASKCVFNMNKPEQLIERISSYAGVVSCRLHPGILSYSLKVPAVGIVWNPKVPGFYNAIHYGNRTITVDGISPSLIMDKLEKAMEEGVEQEEEFLRSVYTTLFYGVKREFCPEKAVEPFTFDKIVEMLPEYEGTSEKEADEKLCRKTRRCYKNYNLNNVKLKQVLLKDKYNLTKNPIPIRYFAKGEHLISSYDEAMGEMSHFENGGLEFMIPASFHNNGMDQICINHFKRDGFIFAGWNIRVRTANTWFWYLDNGALYTRLKKDDENMKLKKMKIGDGAVLPIIPLYYIDSIVLEACWLKQ